MGNRQWRSESDQDRTWNENQQRGQNFGGSRREQKFNEYNQGQRYQPQGGGRGRQSTSRDFNRDFTQGGNYGQNYSSEFNRGQFGGGSRERFGNRQWRGGRDFREADDRQGRYDVGRDFLTNQPIRESYGQMDDDTRDFGQNWGERDFGRRSSRDYGSEFRYSEPNRDFAERGGYSGAAYGNYGWRGEEYDRGRTEFDESIAGRPYWGSNRGYEREGWRAYGSRPGNMGFGDRERPDDWNRGAYGQRRIFGRRSERDLFNTDYGSTQYGGYNRDVDESRRFNRGRDWDRGDYIGAGYYREDYDREERGESLGDKVKNFFGIGPKGWRRGDDKIRDDVSERLEDHPNIDASNLEVMVAEGEVTLTGLLDNRWAKRLAEDVANDVRGVKDVHNQIRVQQAGGFGDTGRTRELTGTAGTTSQTGSTNQPTTATTRKGTERAA